MDTREWNMSMLLPSLKGGIGRWLGKKRLHDMRASGKEASIRGENLMISDEIKRAIDMDNRSHTNITVSLFPGMHTDLSPVAIML